MSGAVDQALARVYRDDGGRILAWLIRVLGGDFQLAEDALQDALLAGSVRWPIDGVPARPGAWLGAVARRKGLDRLRRGRTRREKQPLLQAEAAAKPWEEPMFEQEHIPDERLRLLFTCCHPALAPSARVALTLRTLGGLSTEEIARAFLVPGPTMAQRLVRAKNKIKKAGIPYRVPPADLLPERVPSVLTVIYLVFNEGYSSTRGELMRTDLAGEAIRLGRVLAALLPDEPEACCLLALMLLQHSRRQARTDDAGELVTLEHQDRAQWDQGAIGEGLALVRGALGRGQVGRYGIQAAIAAVHAEARQAEHTDWAQIAALYDLLLSRTPTPVVALNRAAAHAMAFGPDVGLELLADPSVAEPLAQYHLLYAARADLHRRAGRRDAARKDCERALELVQNLAERRFLERRLRELSAPQEE